MYLEDNNNFKYYTENVLVASVCRRPQTITEIKQIVPMYNNYFVRIIITRDIREDRRTFLCPHTHTHTSPLCVNNNQFLGERKRNQKEIALFQNK